MRTVEQLEQCPIVRTFECFGQFSRQNSRPVATEDRSDGLELSSQTTWRNVKDHCSRLVFQRQQLLAPCRFFGVEKSFEHKPVCRQSCNTQRSYRGARSRDGSDVDTGRTCRAYQPESWIADKRRAGIADQRNRRAGLQPRHEFLASLTLVMLVQGYHRRSNPEMIEQPSRVPGVFGGNDADGTKRVGSPRSQIAKIADRSRHDVQNSVLI